MEYIIVNKPLSDLEFHVNKKLQEGYKLQGGVSTMVFEGNWLGTQAMYKSEG
jgi:hypothetical protein